MSKRGPAPKPTQLRVLEGISKTGRSVVSHRQLPANEPMPRRVMPRCPSWLKGEARREWDRQGPRLHKLRLLTEVDGSALAIYCQCWARWVQAESAVEATFDRIGRLNRFEVLIAVRYLTATRQLAGELGLSPAARTRLSVDEGGNLLSDGILS